MHPNSRTDLWCKPKVLILKGSEAFSSGKPAGYLYMNVGNGRRDLPSQNYGNTMLKLQPPMNPCALPYVYRNA